MDHTEAASSSMASSSTAISSQYSSNCSSESDDIEWTPTISTGRKTRAVASLSQTVTQQRRTRKRSLKTEDRRIRKKEQNKTAATRYRIKKKAELEILLEEEAELEQQNQQLQKRHEDLANEVRYLKKLMRELFTSRSVKRLWFFNSYLLTCSPWLILCKQMCYWTVFSLSFDSSYRNTKRKALCRVLPTIYNLQG